MLPPVLSVSAPAVLLHSLLQIPAVLSDVIYITATAEGLHGVGRKYCNSLDTVLLASQCTHYSCEAKEILLQVNAKELLCFQPFPAPTLEGSCTLTITLREGRGWGTARLSTNLWGDVIQSRDNSCVIDVIQSGVGDQVGHQSIELSPIKYAVSCVCVPLHDLQLALQYEQYISVNHYTITDSDTKQKLSIRKADLSLALPTSLTRNSELSDSNVSITRTQCGLFIEYSLWSLKIRCYSVFV